MRSSAAADEIEIAKNAARRAELRQVLEGLPFVAGVALHRLDQIGNEIGAPLQLGLDTAPRFGHDVLAADQPVIDGDPPKGDRESNRDDDQQNHVSDASLWARA